MGLWSKVKGSRTSFKNPNAIGQVRTILAFGRWFTSWSLGVRPFFCRRRCHYFLVCSPFPSSRMLIFSQAIAKNLPASDVIESTSVAGPGFVNIVLSNSWVAKVCFRCFTCKLCIYWYYNSIMLSANELHYCREYKICLWMVSKLGHLFCPLRD